jgi:predicted lipid-binding transport protein (Tim44 family)
MKKLALTILLLSTMLVPARAQLFGPEAWTGAFFGTLLGGLAGADCHHGFSGSGAAIGAGIGFTLGAIAGESNRRAFEGSGTPSYGPVVYAQPGYGYVQVAAPVCLPKSPVVVHSKPAVKSAKRSVGTAKPSHAVVQIPDAPRVPDAPSF